MTEVFETYRSLCFDMRLTFMMMKISQSYDFELIFADNATAYHVTAFSIKKMTKRIASLRF